MLIISSIGRTGLNLAFACIVILLVSCKQSTHPVVLLTYHRCQDIPWSAQDILQIIGRVWRHGQTKEVLVYRVLALGTTDIIVSGVAMHKQHMLQGFLQKPDGKRESVLFRSSLYLHLRHDIRNAATFEGW